MLKHGSESHADVSGGSPHGPSRIWLGIIIVMNILIIGGLSYNLTRTFFA